jgi:hypothetical protein
MRAKACGAVFSAALDTDKSAAERRYRYSQKRIPPSELYHNYLFPYKNNAV